LGRRLNTSAAIGIEFDSKNIGKHLVENENCSKFSVIELFPSKMTL